MISPVLPSGRADRGRGAATLLLLLLLSGILFFFRLGTPGLFDADEPAYAQAAREMQETGDWITPRFNGQPRFDKPALFYWLILLSYRLFGVTEFAVRFWSALAAVLLVLTVAWGARRWLGPPADLYAGLAFMLNGLTALLARAAVTDMLLTLLVTLAILAGVAALSVPLQTSKRWAAAGWAAVGLAVLVKGPVGLVIPALALGGMVLLLREVRTGLVRLCPWQGAVVFAAITFPWYGLVLAANGWAFVEGFIVKHHVTRYAGVISSHAGPLWFYLPVALIGFFPWSGLLPRALWLSGALARRREVRDPADRLLVACLCWAAGVFLFFSFAGTKLPSYLFPAFPALALLVGAAGFSPTGSRLPSPRLGPGISTQADHGPTAGNGPWSLVPGPWWRGAGQAPRWLDTLGVCLIGLTGALLALGFGLVPWILDALRPRVGGLLDEVAVPPGLVWWPAVLVALGTAAGLLAKGSWRPAILSAMMGLLILTAAGMVVPRVYAILQGPLREFTEDAREIVGREGTLVAYGLNAPTIVFYAQRRVTPIGAGAPEGRDQIRRLVEGGHPVAVITRAAYGARLEGVGGLMRLKARGGYAIYCSPCRTERNFQFSNRSPDGGTTGK